MLNHTLSQFWEKETKELSEALHGKMVERKQIQRFYKSLSLRFIKTANINHILKGVQKKLKEIITLILIKIRLSF